MLCYIYFNGSLWGLFQQRLHTLWSMFIRISYTAIYCLFTYEKEETKVK